MAESIHNSPNATKTPIPPFLQSNDESGAGGGAGTTGSSDGLPDFLARIFHPTINGMGAYKDVSALVLLQQPRCFWDIVQQRRA